MLLDHQSQLAAEEVGAVEEEKVVVGMLLGAVLGTVQGMGLVVVKAWVE